MITLALKMRLPVISKIRMAVGPPFKVTLVGARTLELHLGLAE